MGDNFMNFFPADPRLPKPDWPRLRERLRQRGFIKEPRSGGGTTYSVRELWADIRYDRRIKHFRFPYDEVRDLAHLVGGLKEGGVLPADFRTPSNDMSIPELAELLQRDGFVSAEFAPSFEEEFEAGPDFAKFCHMPCEDVTPTVTYEDLGNRIGIYFGPESLCEPPGIPETDRAVENWMELAERWYQDPNEQWIDPETGKGYGLLDLDWENTLGAGRCMLKVRSPGYLNPLQVTELLSDLTGIAFKFCWYHI